MIFPLQSTQRFLRSNCIKVVFRIFLLHSEWSTLIRFLTQPTRTLSPSPLGIQTEQKKSHQPGHLITVGWDMWYFYIQVEIIILYLYPLKNIEICRLYAVLQILLFCWWPVGDNFSLHSHFYIQGRKSHSTHFWIKIFNFACLFTENRLQPQINKYKSPVPRIMCCFAVLQIFKYKASYWHKSQWQHSPSHLLIPICLLSLEQHRNNYSR